MGPHGKAHLQARHTEGPCKLTLHATHTISPTSQAPCWPGFGTHRGASAWQLWAWFCCRMRLAALPQLLGEKKVIVAAEKFGWSLRASRQSSHPPPPHGPAVAPCSYCSEMPSPSMWLLVTTGSSNVSPLVFPEGTPSCLSGGSLCGFLWWGGVIPNSPPE